jgi:hypothetical protein
LLSHSNFLNRSPISALAFYVFGICFFCWRILGRDLEYVPGDAGDTRLINYILEHGYRFISGAENSFWNAGFMYPYKNPIALSDNLIGVFPFYALFRSIGLTEIGAYQFWWIIMISLNFWCCFYACKKWLQEVLLSSIIAFVFAFGFYNISQLGHGQVMVKFCVPLVFYFAYQLYTAPSLKHLGFYLLFTTWQFYSVIYIGFFLFYSSLLLLFVLSVVHKDVNWFKFYFRRENLMKTLLFLGAALLFLILLFLPYMSAIKDVGLKRFYEVVPFLPTFTSYFFSHDSSLLYPFLSEFGKTKFEQWWLFTLFPGFFALSGIIFFMFYFLYKKIKKQFIDKHLLSVFLTALCIFILFLRTESGNTLFFMIFKFPGINSLRALTRILHVEVFLFLLLSAFLIKNHVRPNIIWHLIIILFVIGDNYFLAGKTLRTEKKELLHRRSVMERKILLANPKNYEAIAVLCDSCKNIELHHLDVMVAAQGLNLKTINGYSSSCKDELRPFFEKGDRESLLKWLRYSNIKEERVCIIE